MSRGYPYRMFARLVVMLVALTVTVMATMTSAHAARLSAEPDRAVHVSEMMQTMAASDLSCEDEQYCGTADIEMCGFVCAGLSVSLPLPNGETSRDYGLASPDLPRGEIQASRTPRLDERPPKLRLL